MKAFKLFGLFLLFISCKEGKDNNSVLSFNDFAFEEKVKKGIISFYDSTCKEDCVRRMHFFNDNDGEKCMTLIAYQKRKEVEDPKSLVKVKFDKYIVYVDFGLETYLKDNTAISTQDPGFIDDRIVHVKTLCDSLGTIVPQKEPIIPGLQLKEIKLSK